MYTSVLMVAMLGPGAPPAMSQLPVRQVAYGSIPGQAIYFVPASSPVGLVSSGNFAGPVYYSQPVYFAASPIVTSTYSPVVINSAPVVRYGTPVYSAPLSGGYMPVAAPVCRT